MPVLEQVNLSGRVSHRAIYIYIYMYRIRIVQKPQSHDHEVTG
jgi:hypothetical protein